MAHARLMLANGQTRQATEERVRQALRQGELFWLDLTQPGPEVRALLGGVFHFHELAIEDAEQFHQRPKLDTYDDYFVLVCYGVEEDGTFREVHAFCGQNYVVTVQASTTTSLEQLRDRFTKRGLPEQSLLVLHAIVDALVDSVFPALAHFDDDIDELEDAMLAHPTEQQLGQLFSMKRGLIRLRRILTPERDLFATALTGANAIPGLNPETERYFRDVYDHLIRLSDLVDSYRDLLSGAMDTYLSNVSNRLNVVMKQLTLIATVFLPLTFLTGFFGQNFGWLVNNIDSFPVFAALGVGLPLVVTIGLLMLFRRSGWLSNEPPRKL